MPDADSDQNLVDRFLSEVSDYSQREAAEQVRGVSQKDVSRWRRNDWEYLTGKKRRALKAFLEDRLPETATSFPHGKQTEPEALGGDPSGSPAERLIYYFSHPETRRRFSDHPPMDFVKAAFAIALDEDFSQEELDKLGRWRDEVRDRRQRDARPTGD